MKMTGKSIFKSFASLALAVVMMFTVIGVMPENVSAAEYLFKSSGKSTVTITDEQCADVTNEYAWIKIKPKYDGYLKLKFSNASAYYTYAVGEVALCDGNKANFLSTGYEYNTNYTDSSYFTECYGLKKGTTYYIRVAAYDGVQISAEMKKVSDKSGSKKSKAKSISKNKKSTGLITAGKSQSDWYKINLTKKQKLKINFTPYLTDTVNVTLSGAGVITRTFTLSSNWWGKKDQIYTTGSVRPGAYYIKITPATKTCTGYYAISWK